MKNGAALSLSSGGDRRRCWTEHPAAQSERADGLKETESVVESQA